jgi:hypothetical protein
LQIVCELPDKLVRKYTKVPSVVSPRVGVRQIAGPDTVTSSPPVLPISDAARGADAFALSIPKLIIGINIKIKAKIFVVEKNLTNFLVRRLGKVKKKLGIGRLHRQSIDITHQCQRA